ncbi:MAG: ABC transporter permease [Eubacteriales bacterium]
MKEGKKWLCRTSAFAHRCMLELIRDPLSYVFALGFPLVMLAAMTVLNASLPPEAGMTVFRIDSLAPGVYVFGLSFLMLFTALLLSKDRSEAFLVRLYISPMGRADFLFGYTAPVLLLALGQGVVTMGAALILAAITGVSLSFGGACLVLIASLPAALLFTGFGLLFGSLFHDKAAPPLSSVVISLSSFLGGMWMDLDRMDGAIVTLCDALPFWDAVRVGRMALALDFDGIWPHLAVVLLWAAAVYVLAVLAFRRRG